MTAETPDPTMHASPDTRTWLAQSGALTCAVAGMWVLLVAPASWLAGAAGVEGLTWAAAICLVPGWIAMYLASRNPRAGPQAVAAILGATGLRMAFVLFAVLLMRFVRPELGLREFIVWLLVFYLATLTAETLLVLRKRSARGWKDSGMRDEG